MGGCANVVAALLAVEGNFVCGEVGAGARFDQAASGCRHAEHSSAVGQDPAFQLYCSRMKNFSSVERAGLVEPSNRFPFFVITRIAA